MELWLNASGQLRRQQVREVYQWWRDVAEICPHTAIFLAYSFPVDGTRVAGKRAALQVSDDGGKTWRPLPTLPSTSSAFGLRDLFHAPDGAFLLVGSVNVWRLAH
jgi:hypothetical protein